MGVRSAGLLLARRRPGPEFLLAHPGGPFWARRDLGAWTIPKGVLEAGEEALAGARREFREETGLSAEGPVRALRPVRLKSGKEIQPFLMEADPPLEGFVSNRFELEWPKGSGRRASFAEIDRIAWFEAAEALERIHPGQAPAIAEAIGLLTGG